MALHTAQITKHSTPAARKAAKRERARKVRRAKAGIPKYKGFAD